MFSRILDYLSKNQPVTITLLVCLTIIALAALAYGYDLLPWAQWIVGVAK